MGSATKLRSGAMLFSLVRPGIDILGEAALDVVAAARRRAHRAERKALRVTHIDELLRDRRRVAQEPEPAERIDPLVVLDRAVRHALAADAVKAVAAGDEIAIDRLRLAVGPIGHARPFAQNIVQRDILRLVDGRGAGGGAAVHQILGDLGLPVDHDGLAGQRLEVDAMPHPVDADLRAVMHEAFAVHARADARLVEEIDRDLLDDTGADAAKHVFAGVPFQDDVVDAVLVEKLAEQQARRSRPDDRNLRSHDAAFLVGFHPSWQLRRWRLWNTVRENGGFGWGCAAAVSSPA
jgi:hypothetical protein